MEVKVLKKVISAFCAATIMTMVVVSNVGAVPPKLSSNKKLQIDEKNSNKISKEDPSYVDKGCNEIINCLNLVKNSIEEFKSVKRRDFKEGKMIEQSYDQLVKIENEMPDNCKQLDIPEKFISEESRINWQEIELINICNLQQLALKNSNEQEEMKNQINMCAEIKGLNLSILRGINKVKNNGKTWDEIFDELKNNIKELNLLNYELCDVKGAFDELEEIYRERINKFSTKTKSGLGEFLNSISEKVDTLISKVEQFKKQPTKKITISDLKNKRLNDDKNVYLATNDVFGVINLLDSMDYEEVREKEPSKRINEEVQEKEPSKEINEEVQEKEPSKEINEDVEYELNCTFIDDSSDTESDIKLGEITNEVEKS